MAIRPSSSSQPLLYHFHILTVYMETSEGSQFVSASSVQEDVSMATSLTAEEVIAQATEIIQGQIDGLRSTQEKGVWSEAVSTIWAQVVHVKFICNQSTH